MTDQKGKGPGDVMVAVKKLHPNAVLPVYMTEHAAGLDLHAALDGPLQVAPGDRVLVPTGLAMAIPPGFEGQVRPRSGLAIRQGLTLLNAPGTIDADYRGEVGIIVINHGSMTVAINPGDRIAQLIIAPVCRAELFEVDELEATSRNDGGFGPTGTGKRG